MVSGQAKLAFCRLVLLQSRSVRAVQGRSDRKPSYPVVHGTAGGLPGRYQVGWGEGGVYVRGGCSGAGDSDERDGVGCDPVPVALER